MAWIESHQDLRSNAKARRAARMLDVSVPAVIGHLQCLWWWALDHAFDGDLSHYEPEDIADAAEWGGEPKEFVDALVGCGPGQKAGFLERGGSTVDGRRVDLVLHDWGDYTGYLRSQRSKALSGAHTRWHTNRDVYDPGCVYCRDVPREYAQTPKTSPGHAPGIAGATPEPAEPRSEMPRASPGHAPRNAPTDLPTDLPTEPTNKSGARKRARQLPEDWEPNDTHHRIAGEVSVDIEAEQEQFADFHRAKGSTFKDWDAAFRTWLRNAPKYGGNGVRARDGPSQQAALYRRGRAEAERLEQEMQQ